MELSESLGHLISLLAERTTGELVRWEDASVGDIERFLYVSSLGSVEIGARALGPWERFWIEVRDRRGDRAEAFDWVPSEEPDDPGGRSVRDLFLAVRSRARKGSPVTESLVKQLQAVS